MSLYSIKRGLQTVANVRPEGKLSHKIMGEELVDATFKLTHFVKFQPGDTINVYGNTYYLGKEPQVTEISSKEWQYTLQFLGVKYLLAEKLFFGLDPQNNLTEAEFQIMGTAQTVAALLVQNANRFGGGWTLGTVDATETKLMDFKSENCLQVLSKIADTFKLEFWVDGDKSIHFTERKAASGITLSYGKNKGLKTIDRVPLDGSNIVTRLYASGSDKNLPKGYPHKTLRMDVPYLEKNTDKYGIIEHHEPFEDIFPRHVGTVTGVDAANPFKFSDNTLDFDLNATDANGNTTILIKGLSAKVRFQTGQMAGYWFEIEQYGYNHATRTFTLLKNQEEKNIDIPSAVLRPAIGDTYILEDIMMPQAYADATILELKTKAQDYLDKNSLQRFLYTPGSDAIYFKRQNIDIQIGQTVHFLEPDFDLDADLRIIAITKDLQDKYNVQMEAAENAQLSTITRAYFQQEKQQTAIINEQKYNAALARAAYYFASEFHENVFDSSGYFDPQKIKPLSIETKHIFVGDRMQQFTMPGVSFFIENNNLFLRNTAGTIEHLTIQENGVRVWNIPSATVSISSAYLNIYVKAQKVGSNANIVATTEQKKVDGDPDFYYFEVGSISSISNGYRRIKTNYGFAQINPAELSIGKISDPSGNNYIELLQDRININARVTFGAGSSGYNNLTDKPDLDALKQAAISASQAYADAQDAVKETATKAYADGVVTAAEQRNILDATNKAEAAKTFAQAQDALLKTQLEAFADGLVDAEESARITQAQNNLAAAKAYSDAQDVLAKTAANAYADGKITAEEARAIADATAKMEAAKTHAQTLVNNVQIGGRNMLRQSKTPPFTHYGGSTGNIIFPLPESEGTNVGSEVTYVRSSGGSSYIKTLCYLGTPKSGEVVSVSFKTKVFIDPVTFYSNQGGREETVSNDGKIHHVKWEGIVGDNYGSIQIQGNGSGELEFYIWDVMYENSTKCSAWSPNPKDVEASILQTKNDSINASKSYADAQDAVKETTTKAYADGVVTAAENRAIQDATNRADAAKTFAQAQDALLKTQLQAYADGAIDTEEQNRINQAQANLQAAKNYADAQDNLAKIAANAYADGIVDAEELRAIADATAKMEAAKTHAQTLVNDIHVGGRNYSKNLNSWNYLGLYNVFSENGNKVVVQKIVSGESGAATSNIIKRKGSFFAAVNVQNTSSISNLRIYIDTRGTVTNSNYEQYRSGIYFTLPPNFNDRIVIYSNSLEEIELNWYFGIDGSSAVISAVFSYPQLSLGNKATDWTPAPEDVETVIATAQSTANTANTKLTEIASDSILSASEKQATKKEWDVIAAEKTTVENQAATVGISALTYQNAYADLSGYIAPLLSDLTVNSAIDGNAFRNYFKNYYEQKIILLKAVTDKINQGLTAVQTLQNSHTSQIAEINSKTDWISPTVDPNINAFMAGTFAVGNPATGVNALLTGLGGANDVFLAAGFTNILDLAGGRVWIKRNGHFKFKTSTGLEFDSESGFIGGRYSNGQLGFKLSMEQNNPQFAFFKSDGTKVYSLGQNGIYYVSEIAESFTLWRLLNLNTNASTSDLTTFHNALRSSMWQKASNPVQFELRGNKDSYLYEAGQNANSQTNEQYEGYKDNNSDKYTNISDGWYAIQQLGDMMQDAVNDTLRIVEVMRLQNGKVVQSGTTAIETNGYVFNQY